MSHTRFTPNTTVTVNVHRQIFVCNPLNEIQPGTALLTFNDLGVLSDFPDRIPMEYQAGMQFKARDFSFFPFTVMYE